MATITIPDNVLNFVEAVLLELATTKNPIRINNDCQEGCLESYRTIVKARA